MLNQENIKKIEEIVKEFFEKTGFEPEISVKHGTGLTICVDLQIEEPQILIGENGSTLVDIQRLINAMLKRIIKEPFYIDLDIQGYKKKKNEYLRDLAQSEADQVVLTKKEKTLIPMLAYERRIVHLELAERKDVISESIGSEPERSVKIRIKE